MVGWPPGRLITSAPATASAVAEATATADATAAAAAAIVGDEWVYSF